jgi:hypothetical protein
MRGLLQIRTTVGIMYIPPASMRQSTSANGFPINAVDVVYDITPNEHYQTTLNPTQLAGLQTWRLEQERDPDEPRGIVPALDLTPVAATTK